MKLKNVKIGMIVRVKDELKHYKDIDHTFDDGSRAIDNCSKEFEVVGIDYSRHWQSVRLKTEILARWYNHKDLKKVK